MLLVGDSVAMVVHGHDTTLPITLDEMLAHCKAVARGARRAFLVGDMPFGSGARAGGWVVGCWRLGRVPRAACCPARRWCAGHACLPRRCATPLPCSAAPSPLLARPPAAACSGGEPRGGGALRGAHDEGGPDGRGQDRGRVQVRCALAPAALAGGPRGTPGRRRGVAAARCTPAHARLPQLAPALPATNPNSHPPSPAQQPRQGSAGGGGGGGGGDGARGPDPAVHQRAGRLPPRRAVGCAPAGPCRCCPACATRPMLGLAAGQCSRWPAAQAWHARAPPWSTRRLAYPARPPPSCRPQPARRCA